MNGKRSQTTEVVAIVDDSHAAGADALREVLELAGFWSLLARALKASKASKSEFRILIHPDTAGFTAESKAVTNPRLIENLIDLLHEQGFSNSHIAVSADTSSLWAENRDIYSLCDLLGYRFVTPAGNDYDILDLSDDLQPLSAPAGWLLDGSQISSSWSQADWKIVFAKNKTDEMQGVALGLQNLLGILPRVDKDYFYHHRWSAEDVATEILQCCPVNFALIDAIESVHGSGGSRAPAILETDTLIASSHVLLADYVACLKMGVEPGQSLLNRKAMETVGLPNCYEVRGNLARYPGWKNVSPGVISSVQLREDAVVASRALKPWIQQMDTEVFPHKRALDEQLNARLAPLLSDLDSNRGAEFLYIALNHLIWQIQNLSHTCKVLWNKDGLKRKEVAVGIDRDSHPEKDYHDLVDELAFLHEQTAALVKNQNGLCWAMADDAIIFEFTRIIPLDYEEFVARVDISKVIQYMYDYIGGGQIVIAADGQDRPVCLAERNLYLPQPNYVVIGQGRMIDVTKLELVEYHDDSRSLFWKTIASENESAVYDDGIATFSRAQDGTRVSIKGRQQFNLPVFWETLKNSSGPALEADLIEHAYTVFFQRTVANLEAVAEGREIRAGKSWFDSNDVTESEVMPSETLEALFNDMLEKYGDAFSQDLSKLLSINGKSQAAESYVDEAGFTHVRGAHARVNDKDSTLDDGMTANLLRTATDTVSGFLLDITRTVQRDMNWPAARD